MAFIHTRPEWAIAERDATPESQYLDRRRLLQNMAAGAVAAGVGGLALPQSGFAQAPLAARRTMALNDAITKYDSATHYNNYYEFGTDKEDPARNAHSLHTRPWTVKIGGLVKKPMTLDIDKLTRLFPLEERVYRFRCVETWAMVIPWVGFPLAKLIDMVQPQSGAQYIAFRTLDDSRQMPGVREPVLQWPYREGLRMDEARHPLAMLVLGMYDKVLPNQNGAPLRLIVPWKYGYKSIKSIVSLDFVSSQPQTSWNLSAPNEYGFYSNVNPDVDHPRWSQARERRLGEWLQRRTLPFNGYGNEVAALYKNMDLRKYH